MRGVLIAAMALAACESRQLVALPTPPAEARALFVAISGEFRFEVHALDVGADGSFTLPAVERSLEAGAALRLEVVADARTLASRAIVAGLLPAASPGRPVSAVPGGKVQRLEVVAGEPLDAWRETDERSPELEAFRFERPAGACRDFVPRGERMDNEPARYATGLDGQTVLVGALDATLLVTESGRRRLDPGVPGGGVDGVASGPDLAWLVDDAGDIVRARLRPNAELLERIPTAVPYYRWIGATPDPEARDVFALTPDGLVDHYDGQTVERAGALEPFETRVGERPAGGVAWVGPREAVVAYPSVQGLTRVRFDEATASWTQSLEPAPGARAAFLTVRHVPGFGTVAGNSDGQFFVRKERGWVELEGSPLHVFAYIIEPYEDGFVYGSAFGSFGQYTPREGYCPLLINVMESEIRNLATMASGAVFAVGGKYPSYTWLEP